MKKPPKKNSKVWYIMYDSDARPMYELKCGYIVGPLHEPFEYDRYWISKEQGKPSGSDDLCEIEFIFNTKTSARQALVNQLKHHLKSLDEDMDKLEKEKRIVQEQWNQYIKYESS